MADNALPVEGLNAEALAEFRRKRLRTANDLKGETSQQMGLVKQAQLAEKLLTDEEDILRSLGGVTANAATGALLATVRERVREQVMALGEMWKRAKTAAVHGLHMMTVVFQDDADDSEYTEEQLKRFKEEAKKQEKEKERLQQQQVEAAAAVAAHRGSSDSGSYEWQGGRGRGAMMAPFENPAQPFYMSSQVATPASALYDSAFFMAPPSTISPYFGFQQN